MADTRKTAIREPNAADNVQPATCVGGAVDPSRKSLPLPKIRRKRELVNGRRVLVSKQTLANRANAKPKTIRLVTGVPDKVLRKGAIPNKNTTLGRMYVAESAALVAHIGGDPSVAQAKLIDDAVRLGLIAEIAWHSVMQAQSVVKGERVHPALEAYLRATKERRAILQTLGIKRHTREKGLADILRGGDSE